MTATFSVGKYRVGVDIGLPPALFPDLVSRAALFDDLRKIPSSHRSAPTTPVFVTAGRGDQEWPPLVVALYCDPGPESGFHPGVHLIQETDLLLIGAGECLAAYDLEPPMRRWVEDADVGFWRWAQHGDVVVMSAELQLAAWDIHGARLWSTFVEPPWSYSVGAGTVELDIMGTRTRFDLREGPHPVPRSPT